MGTHYSRTIRINNHIYVFGATATYETGKIIGAGDVRIQTIQAFKNIERELQKAGAFLADVVCTRILVTNMYDWETTGKVHSEFFGTIHPATSLIEMEAEAIVRA